MNRYNKIKREKKKRTTNSINYDSKSFDELIEEAIIQEEKGERYVDGLKARKFYETACELYEKANTKKNNDFSCLYNWGRVTYILATFSRPPYSDEKKTELFQNAIIYFRKALELNNEDCDALFNLKQALSSLGELYLDNDYEEVAIPFFKEASELADRLYVIQKSIFQKSIEGDQAISRSDNPEAGENMETVEMMAEERDDITINSIIETLASQAEDLNNLANIVDSEDEATFYFAEAEKRLKQAEEEAKAEEVRREAHEHSHEHEHEHEHDHEEIEEIDLNPIDSAYANIHSTQAERQFNNNGLFIPELFERALARQERVLSRIPEASNSQIVYQEKAKELCNKADLLCTYAEITKHNGEEFSEASASQRLYQQALQTYQQALTFEDSNVSIMTKIGDVHLILANNYRILSQQLQDTFYQNMLQLIRQGLDAYKLALHQQAKGEDEPIEPEIYLRIAKGLSYFEDKMSQCQDMLRRFLQAGGSLDMIQEDGQYVDFDFSDEVMHQSWFQQGMNQL